MYLGSLCRQLNEKVRQMYVHFLSVLLVKYVSNMEQATQLHCCVYLLCHSEFRLLKERNIVHSTLWSSVFNHFSDINLLLLRLICLPKSFSKWQSLSYNYLANNICPWRTSTYYLCS